MDIQSLEDITAEVISTSTPLDLLSIALSLPGSEPSQLQSTNPDGRDVMAVGFLEENELALAELISRMTDIVAIEYDSYVGPLSYKEWIRQSEIYLKMSAVYVFLRHSMQIRLGDEFADVTLYWDVNGYILTDDKERIAKHKSLVKQVIEGLEE